MKALLIIFLSSPYILFAQNLVANSSFESYTSCPDDFFQITKAAPWFSPECDPLRPDAHGLAVFFNRCNNTNVGVPNNVFGYLDANRGFGYAGIEAVSHRRIGPYRQYLETKLSEPLQAGKKYYFSMYYALYDNSFNNAKPNICLNTDSIGAYFSKTIIDKNPDCLPLNFTPQIHAPHQQIFPSTIWREIAGCYIAKGDEEYLMIGNFAGNGFSDCTGVDTTGYFIFVDDVILMADKAAQKDTLLCEGESLNIDGSLLRNEYKLFPNWKYKWNDGNTSSNRSLDKPGKYTLTVNLNDCVNDVYNFTITNKKCSCQPFVPTAFTPNGDLLNDIFLPKLSCVNSHITDYRFSIYDRWGRILFYSLDKNNGWDGKIKGKKALAGVYLYQIQYMIAGGTKYNITKGTVNLIR